MGWGYRHLEAYCEPHGGGAIDGHLICFVLKHVCMYVCMLVRGEGLVG